MTMLVQRPLPREHLENCVSNLAAKYPACFFEDPRMRRPLKINIVSDLQKEGVSAEIIAGVSFYMRNWEYQRSLQAGAERVDLNGKKAGVVTEQEQLNAQKKVREEKEELARKNNAGSLPAVSVLRSLHEAGKISTDQLSKVTLPATPPARQTMSPKSSPVLARLQTLLERTNTLLIETEDEALRSALAGTCLRLVVSEAQRVIASFEGQVPACDQGRPT